MRNRLLVLLAFTAGHVSAQTVCAPTSAYSPCEILFELDAAELKQHPNPYWTVELRAEVRSPQFKTTQTWAFWDGGNRMLMRIAPTEPGQWDFRLTSNLPRFDGKTGKFEATASDNPGFVRVANVRHWMHGEARKPHLWMGDTNYALATMDRSAFEQWASKRAAQKFNHVRGYLLGGDPQRAFPAPDKPDIAYFQELDKRLKLLNEKGITADLVIGHAGGQLLRQFPERQQRDRLIRYLGSRYAAYGITWQLVQEFETYTNSRAVLREIGELLKKYDAQAHPRTTHAAVTSSPLVADGWMDYLSYQSADDQLCAVERQIYTKPFVNAGFGVEGSSSTGAAQVDSDTFRKRLWRSAMNGQYPTYANAATLGAHAATPGASGSIDLGALESAGAKYMTNWFDLFSRTRWWDLEPYFDVDGGRAMALEDVEYIVYVEKPAGPVELIVERHGYEVYWFNPISGEYLKQKDWKGDKFVGEPPDKSHDWVLHLSRDGRKEGMLKSYKFESRPVPVQEVEAVNLPFEVATPQPGSIPSTKPVPFEMKLKRQSRATRAMQYLITAEAIPNVEGFRVVGSGDKGELRFPDVLKTNLPATITLRVTALNANGKAYAVDRVYTLTP